MKKKYRFFLYGVGTGAIGLGLQNYNPLEPRVCTHFCSISLGLSIFVVTLYVIPMVGWLKDGIKEYMEKRATRR